MIWPLSFLMQSQQLKRTILIFVVLFSLLGMGGSYAVAWFGIRVNTFANARAAFASLRGKLYDVHEIPLRSGMSIGMVLISLELLMMLTILLFLPADVAGASLFLLLFSKNFLLI